MRFFLDDPAMSGVPYKTENNAPWDLAGTTSSGLALPFDTRTLPDGVHSVTAAIELSTGGTETLTAQFAVTN